VPLNRVAQLFVEFSLNGGGHAESVARASISNRRRRSVAYVGGGGIMGLTVLRGRLGSCCTASARRCSANPCRSDAASNRLGFTCPDLRADPNRAAGDRRVPSSESSRVETTCRLGESWAAPRHLGSSSLANGGVEARRPAPARLVARPLRACGAMGCGRSQNRA
jgi:hypothetical protein